MIHQCPLGLKSERELGEVQARLDALAQDRQEILAAVAKLEARLFGADDNGDRGVLNRHAARIGSLERTRAQAQTALKAGAAVIVALAGALAWVESQWGWVRSLLVGGPKG